MKKVAINIIIISLILIITIKIVVIANASTLITIVDDTGRIVTIKSSERIVSIGPSCTEILYALGLGNKVIGVDRYSDYPPEVISKQKISNWWTPDPEEVAALNPDLVLYSVGSMATVEALEKAGLTVVALKPTTINDIFKNIKLIGFITGKSKEAESLVSSLSKRIDEIKSKTSNITIRPKVYMEIYYPPPWTFGPGSWVHQIIELAGGINIFSDAPVKYVKTTDEEVIARNPNVIISLLGAMHYATLEDIKSRLGWNKISAVIKGTVYLLDENLFVRPSPRIVEGLETLAKILHPELFGEAYVFTFPIEVTKLRLGVQTFNIFASMKVDIYLIKAVANSTLTVTLRKLGPELPANRKLIGNYLDINCSVPEGLVFILRIYYSEDLLRTLGVKEGSLKIYEWNEKEKQWITLNSAINEEENYIEATITYLSHFALMGEPIAPFLEYSIPLWLFIISIIVIIMIVGIWVRITYKKVNKSNV
jgi:iron complex transport system substrate-binding protein